MLPHVAISKAKFTPAEIAVLGLVIHSGHTSGSARALDIPGVVPRIVEQALHSLARKNVLRAGDRWDETEKKYVEVWALPNMARAEWAEAINARIAALEVTPPAPPLAPELARVLRWYSGKAQQNAKEALDLLAASIAHGSWLPGSSRKVAAALSKSNVAAKLAKSIGHALDSVGSHKGGLSHGWGVTLALSYGLSQRAPGILAGWAGLEADADARQLAYLTQAKPFFEEFLPVAEIVARLDATRPVPVFTSLGVSATITTTLENARLDLDLATIRVCPIEYKMLEVIDEKTGHVVHIPEAHLLWPKGTKHGASRFGYSSRQCHACGYAIKNPCNWVPLLMDSKRGVPHSLWVGRDCAKSVFGVEMSGDLNLAEGER